MQIFLPVYKPASLFGWCHLKNIFFILKSNLSVFVVVAHSLESYPRNDCLTHDHEDLFVFSSISLLLAFSFRFVVHFKSVFAYVMRSGVNLILLHIDIQFVPVHLLKLHVVLNHTQGGY